MHAASKLRWTTSMAMYVQSLGVVTAAAVCASAGDGVLSPPACLCVRVARSVYLPGEQTLQSGL